MKIRHEIRHALLCLLVVCSGMSFGQKKDKTVEVYPMPVSEQTRKITYQDVVSMKDAKPAELYDRAYAWAQKFFQNPTKVIRTADKENGVLLCSSNLKIHTPTKDGKSEVMAGIVNFELRIEARDGRYRYTLTDFVCKNGAVTQPCEQWLDQSKAEWTPVRNGHLKEVDTYIQTLIRSLEEGMEPKEEVKDEW